MAPRIAGSIDGLLPDLGAVAAVGLDDQGAIAGVHVGGGEAISQAGDSRRHACSRIVGNEDFRALRDCRPRRRRPSLICRAPSARWTPARRPQDRRHRLHERRGLGFSPGVAAIATDDRALRALSPAESASVPRFRRGAADAARDIARPGHREPPPLAGLPAAAGSAGTRCGIFQAAEVAPALSSDGEGESLHRWPGVGSTCRPSASWSVQPRRACKVLRQVEHPRIGARVQPARGLVGRSRPGRTNRLPRNTGPPPRASHMTAKVPGRSSATCSRRAPSGPHLRGRDRPRPR